MEKQRNRGQDGAGMANIKLDTPAGKRYISRKRSTTDNPIQDLFAQINQRFIDLEESDPDKLNDIDWLKNNMPFTGELFLGHLRYGTYGGNSIEQCHPFLRQNNWKTRNLALAGNFNMTNVDELFGQLTDLGQHPKEKSDTITIIEKIGHFLDEEKKLILMILNKDLMQRIKCGEWKMCRCMISLKNKVFSHIEFMIHQLNTSGMKSIAGI